MEASRSSCSSSSSSCTLEITIISGEDLRLGSRQSVKKNAFVTIRTDPFSAGSTEIDAEGGSFPAWNQKLVMNMPSHARFITVEVHCKTFSGNRLVGTAGIPTSDFRGGYVPDNYLHFLSYRLRDGKGCPNGIINLAVKVKVPENAGAARGAGAGVGVGVGVVLPAAKYPSPCHGITVAGKLPGGTVTGVPIWYGSKCKL